MEKLLRLTGARQDSTVVYAEEGMPFRLLAELGDWRLDNTAPDSAHLEIRRGRLEDRDKGAFPLDGLWLLMRLTPEGVLPLEVKDPAGLTELQQVFVLGAVAGQLMEWGCRFGVVPVPFGLLAAWQGKGVCAVGHPARIEYPKTIQSWMGTLRVERAWLEDGLLMLEGLVIEEKST